MKPFLLLYAGMLCCITGWAQEHYWTLESCIALAQDSQYAARNALLEEQQAGADKRAAWRALLPAISATAGYEYAGTRIAGYGQQAAAGLVTRLPLFQGGFLRKQLSYREAIWEYTRGQRKRTAAAIKWAVVELYLKTLQARADRAAAREVAAQLHAYATEYSFVATGYLLQKYDQVVAVQEQAYELSYRQLMTYLYQPLNNGDSLVDPGRVTPVYGNFDAAINNGLLTDAGIRVDRLYLAATKTLVRYKKRAAWPALYMEGYYGPLWKQTGAVTYPGTDLNGQLSLRFNAPLFNNSSIRKEKEQAVLSEQQAALRLKEDERLLYQDMFRYYAQHQLSSRNLYKAEATLKTARHWLTATRPGTTVDLLMAADQLYTAWLDRNAAWNQLVYQTLWIDFNSGRL